MATFWVVQPSPDCLEPVSRRGKIHSPQHFREYQDPKITRRVWSAWPVCHDFIGWVRKEERQVPRNCRPPKQDRGEIGKDLFVPPPEDGHHERREICFGQSLDDCISVLHPEPEIGLNIVRYFV